jgi:hypothetical protein
MITIAWDVDDVLNNLTEVWLAAQPNAPAYEALAQNPPIEQLGLSLEAYRASLDLIRATRFADLAPNPDVLAWFRAYGCRARHMALTAVPRDYASVSAAWTLRHFGDWIRSFTFIPSARAHDAHPAYDTTKGQYLARCGGVRALVEDSEANASAARQLGLSVCLFPQPWNSARGGSVPALLDRLTQLVGE